MEHTLDHIGVLSHSPNHTNGLLPSHSADAGALLQWAEQHEIKMENATIGAFTHGGKKMRGLAATAPIGEGDIVVEVPNDMLISSSADTAPPGWGGAAKGLQQTCHSAWREFKGRDRLILRILYEQSLGTKSKWDVYLKSLPLLDEYKQHIPVATSEDNLKKFRGLPVADEALRVQHELRGLQKTAIKCFPGSHAWDKFDSFLHAASITTTRAYETFFPSANGGEDGMLLAPISDLANTLDEPLPEPDLRHTLENESTGWTLKPEGFELFAKHYHDRGDEVLEPYSSATNNEESVLKWGIYLGKQWSPQDKQLDSAVCAQLNARSEFVDRINFQDDGKCKIGAAPVMCNLARLANDMCTQHDTAHALGSRLEFI